MSERSTRGWLCAVAIIMLVVSLTLLSTAISGVMNPFLKYNGMHFYVLITCLLAFLFLVAGGILGIMGVKRRRSVCLHIMFWFLLFSTLWTLGVAGNMYGLYMVYASRDGETTCAAAFEHLKDFDYIATLGSLGLCKSATCACNISGIDGTYPGSGVTGAFSNANGSYKKVQECE